MHSRCYMSGSCICLMNKINKYHHIVCIYHYMAHSPLYGTISNNHLHLVGTLISIMCIGMLTVSIWCSSVGMGHSSS